MFMVDIAVPRDIDPQVAELEDVYLFSIDDLQGVVDENLESRREAAREADELIAGEVDRFEQGQRTLDAAPTIRRLREDAEATRAQTFEQARRMLGNGRSPEEALEFLSRTLTNRLLHGPSQRLREAAEHEDHALLAALSHLYDPDHDR
jgi:glutamyl-tRNA reductase